MIKKEIIQTVVEMNEKYTDLVWLARTSPDNYDIEGVRKNIERIEKTYPKEVELLINGDNPNWEHGFNSGILAGMRYIMDMIDENKDFADSLFPNLDS
jgi:hypothetical protein